MRNYFTRNSFRDIGVIENLADLLEVISNALATVKDWKVLKN